MQNTTSLQTSNYNTIPKHEGICLNTGITDITEQSKCPYPESLAKLRNIIFHEVALFNLPFGEIKYESRRRGSFLEFTFSSNNAKLCACAVSSQGLNRQFWDELVTDYSTLQKMNAVIRASEKNAKAPEQSPWIAWFMYEAITDQITGSELIMLLILMKDLAYAFIIDSATNSGVAPVRGETQIA